MDRTKPMRNSNIELYRIVLMLIIIAHHYVVNSGIMDSITKQNALNYKSVFSSVFGWGGKTAIDCFVLITGYFVCKSSIKVMQWVKLLCEIEFYNIVIFIIFYIAGIQPFSVKAAIKCIIPFYTLGTEFVSSYLVFFWFIPFINLLLKQLDKNNHLRLILLCFISDSVFQTVIRVPDAFTYVGLFMYVYLIGAYIRRYRDGDYKKTNFEESLFVTGSGKWALGMLLISWISIICGLIVFKFTGYKIIYMFTGQSNRILAIATAVCSFVFFVKINIKQSKLINTVAKSVFGVLMIHANSLTMIDFVWRKLFKSQWAFENLGPVFIVHAFVSVIVIFSVCSVIDMIRIRFLEKPTFQYFDKRSANLVSTSDKIK